MSTAARHGGTSSSRRASASTRASRRTESRSSAPSPGSATTASDPAPKGARQGIIFWDAATGREVRYVPGGPCPAHAFSQNGPFVDPRRPVAGIAYASSTRPGDGPACDPQRSAIIHLDLRTGNKTELETGDTSLVGGGFGDSSTSADGRYVAIAGAGRTSVVDTVTDREVFEQAVTGGSATLSKDGSKDRHRRGRRSSDALGRPLRRAPGHVRPGGLPVPRSPVRRGRGHARRHRVAGLGRAPVRHRLRS